MSELKVVLTEGNAFKVSKGKRECVVTFDKDSVGESNIESTKQLFVVIMDELKGGSIGDMLPEEPLESFTKEDLVLLMNGLGFSDSELQEKILSLVDV